VKTRTVQVGEVCERIDYGFTASADFSIKAPRLLRITDIQEGTVDWDHVPGCTISAEEENENRLEVGDIVFARTGATTGKSFLIRHAPRAVFASYLIRLRASREILPEYLAAFCHSEAYWHQINGAVRGAAQGGVNSTMLSSLLLPLPDLSEQRRIAGQLERADRLRRTRRYALALSDTFLPAAFRELFGDPRHNPKRFGTTTIGESLKFKSGDSMTAAMMGAGGQYPVYGGNGISGYHTSYRFEDRQIVIGRVGAYCGVVHYTDPQCWVSDNALYVTEKDRRFNEIYLVHTLKQAHLNQYADQAGQPLISHGRLEKVALLVPPVALQERWAGLVARHERLRSIQRESLRQADHLFQTVLQWAFRGDH
jgi:type I restriction enzyme S subunit